MTSAPELVERLAQETPYWGMLHAAMRFKRDAVAAFGLEAAFRLCQAHLQMPDLQVLRERPLRGMRAAAMAHGWQYTELWRGGGRFERPLPQVTGPGNHGPLPGIGRSGWLACIPDAVVRSRSAYVLSAGEALLDFEGAELEGLEDQPAFDASILHGTRERVWTMEGAQPSLQLDEAFLLTGRYALDFGHWITEYIPRYMLARLAGLADHLPLLVDPRAPATVREALAAMLPPGARIVEAPHLGEVAVAKLWCAANPVFNAHYPVRMDERMWSILGAEAKRFAPLLREWTRLAGAQVEAATGIERLYLARKPSNRKKRLRNQDAIEAIAVSRGFEIRHPEDYSIAEQIRLVRNAGHVVAPEGSNALLASFARPGSKALFLSPPYTLPLVDVNSILAEMGIGLTVLTGPDFELPYEDFCGYWNDYEVDPALFERVLDEWLGGTSTQAPPDPSYAAWADFYDAVEGDREPLLAFYRGLLDARVHSLLELGCGTGAIAAPLFEALRALHPPGTALRMAGVDNSAAMLARARQREPAIEWALGDLRYPPVAGRFDLVTCPFNTLQLMTDEDSLLRALRAARARTAEGGRFAFDIYQPNEAFLAQPRRDIPTRGARVQGRELRVLEDTHYEPGTRLLHMRWRLVDEAAPTQVLASTEYRIRQWQAVEVEALLLAAGFTVLERYGDFDRSPHGPRARKQIYVCSRDGNPD